jgi:acetoacetyl-CoA synthetase
MEPEILWSPNLPMKENSHLFAYMQWVEDQYHVSHHYDYETLWSWSTEHSELFWESLLRYFNVTCEGEYTQVNNRAPMPYTRWFEGLKLNYAEQIFQKKTTQHPAIIFKHERMDLPQEISWEELYAKVSAFASFLKEAGVQKGDRVAAFLPNIPEASIALLACMSLGAIWSSCSPDFGASSVIDRFQQINPKIFITVDGYTYNGKVFDKSAENTLIASALTSVSHVVLVTFLGGCERFHTNQEIILWEHIISESGGEITFERVGFNDPLWVLYSSGTTGKPKAITHSHGGMLLEHLKYLHFHNDVKPGERFFWFSTTGWMMWNFVHATWLTGATIVLYEGSPSYTGLHMLWEFAEHAEINHFGTSAPFIVACMKSGLEVNSRYNLSSLRSVGSTGSPLPPEAFSYIYRHVSDTVWLCSMSGGTDVCTAFVGGNPILPVRKGEIQSRTLGCALEVWSDSGQPLSDGEIGEMVITKPMPCMPVCFWNDPDGSKYLSAYFEYFKGVWRHGDWVKLSKDKGLVILGRSDATLNRHGVRIGTAEIYASVQKIKEIRDALVVNLELSGGKHFMPLFVVMTEGCILDDYVKEKVVKQLKQDYTPRHVPDEIIEVPDIPYTISGKKLEAPVKKILLGMSEDKVSSRDALKNPEALTYFKVWAEKHINHP